MTKTCRFCFFKQRAEVVRARAQEYVDAGLNCVAGPLLQVARDLDGLIYAEKSCTCDAL